MGVKIERPLHSVRVPGIVGFERDPVVLLWRGIARLQSDHGYLVLLAQHVGHRPDTVGTGAGLGREVLGHQQDSLLHYPSRSLMCSYLPHASKRLTRSATTCSMAKLCSTRRRPDS